MSERFIVALIQLQNPSLVTEPRAVARGSYTQVASLIRSLPRQAGVLNRKKSRPAGIHGGVSQRLLYAQQLIVLGYAIAARERARFDLTGVRVHCEIGDEGVFSFT